MSRLWDKGEPLARRVLEFTAGEDHALDNRLVRFCVSAPYILKFFVLRKLGRLK